jgi:hypothetical protein
MAEMPLKKYRGLTALLEDAKQCVRLSDRDEDFLANQRIRVQQYGRRVFFSEAQEKWLQDIEKRVYLT